MLSVLRVVVIECQRIRDRLAASSQVMHIRTRPERSMGSSRMWQINTSPGGVQDMAMKQQQVARRIVPAQDVKGVPVCLDVRHRGERRIHEGIKVGPFFMSLSANQHLACYKVTFQLFSRFRVSFRIHANRRAIGDVPEM